jgi:hypothetical protein
MTKPRLQVTLAVFLYNHLAQDFSHLYFFEQCTRGADVIRRFILISARSKHSAYFCLFPGPTSLFNVYVTREGND